MIELKCLIFIFKKCHLSVSFYVEDMFVEPNFFLRNVERRILVRTQTLAWSVLPAWRSEILTAGRNN